MAKLPNPRHSGFQCTLSSSNQSQTEFSDPDWNLSRVRPAVRPAQLSYGLSPASQSGSQAPAVVTDTGWPYQGKARPARAVRLVQE